MVFHTTHKLWVITYNIAKSAKHMLCPFIAVCHIIRKLAQEHHLIDKPYALLWLAKCCAIPASMYACQVWGTQFVKKGSDTDSPLQTALVFPQIVLGFEKNHA